jgi:glutamate racemase
VGSEAYSRAVRALDPGVTVFSVATPKFVDVVEAGLRMGPGQLEDALAEVSDVFIRPSFYEMARDYLDPLKRIGVDTLVLGCTHFPLLAPAIQQVMGPKVRIISSAEETAIEVAETLSASGRLAPAGPSPVHRFVTTGDAGEFAHLGSRILRRTIATAEHVDVSVLEELLPPGEGGVV